MRQLREFHALHPEIAEVAAGSFREKQPPEIVGCGYVVKSLEAALWAFHDAKDFREAVLRAVNLGDDADTTGAVCGQLAGAYWGESGIPAGVAGGAGTTRDDRAGPSGTVGNQGIRRANRSFAMKKEEQTDQHRLSDAELLQLRRWNTPTIYNGWEQITRHDAGKDGFNIEEARDFMPQMGPMVGYAVTVVFEPSNPEHRRKNPNAWSEYRHYVGGVPGPKIVVVQDLDKPRVIGAFWGEVTSSFHRALGCVGTIIDGGIRDLDEMNNVGFKALARRLCVGHAYATPVRWGCEVEVFRPQGPAGPVDPCRQTRVPGGPAGGRGRPVGGGPIHGRQRVPDDDRRRPGVGREIDGRDLGGVRRGCRTIRRQHGESLRPQGRAWS